MTSIETTGRTVEEAIEAGLDKLGVEKENVNIEVLEEASRGFLGILGTREAKVRLEVIFTPEELAQEFILKICECMNLKVDISHNKKGEYHHFYLTGEDMGILIGRRGDTLNALQYLVNLAVNKKLSKIGARARIIVDIEGYRKKREKTLERLAMRFSEKVKKTGTKVGLEPMNAQERRIIHYTLQGSKDVETYSEGDDPYRKVVIAPK